MKPSYRVLPNILENPSSQHLDTPILLSELINVQGTENYYLFRPSSEFEVYKITSLILSLIAFKRKRFLKSKIRPESSTKL